MTNDMKNLVEKYLKQSEHHTKAKRKSNYWRDMSQKTLKNIEKKLMDEDLLSYGNIIDIGNGYVIVVDRSVSFGWRIDIKEKTICKN